MAAVSWTLRLGVDGVGEVRAATKALQDVRKVAGEVDKATKGAAAGARDAKGRFLPKGSQGTGALAGIAGAVAGASRGVAAAGPFDRALGFVARIFGAAGRMVGKGQELAGQASESVEGVIGTVSKLSPYLTAAKKVLEIGAAAVGAVLGAQSFKEDTMFALQTLLKSKGAAESAYKGIVATADFLGQGRQEALTQFSALLGQGFTMPEVDKMVRSFADLAAVDPSANLGAIVNAIAKIKATGKLQGDELNMLAEAKLPPARVYEQLAKSMGKTVDEIRKMQAAGQLGADDTIAAILAAINEQAGGLPAGTLAARKSLTTLSGLLKRLRSIPGDILVNLEVGEGFEGVKAFLREVVSYFDATSQTGERLRDVLSLAFNELMGGLLGGDPTQGAKGVRAGLDGVLDTVEALAKSGALRSWGDGLRAGGEAALTVIAAVGKVSSALRALQGASTSASESVPTALKFIFAPVYIATQIPGIIREVIGALFQLATAPEEAMRGAIETVQGWGAALSSFASQLTGEISNAGQGVVAAATGLGLGIVSGIVQGITSGAMAVVDAIANVARSAVATAKGILDQHSPSRVFAEIGYFTTEGFAQGVASNDNASTAVSDMTAAATNNARTAVAGVAAAVPLPAMQAARADIAPPDVPEPSTPLVRSARLADTINLTINVPVGPATDRRELARTIAEEVQRTLDSIALQLGAVAA